MKLFKSIKSSFIFAKKLISFGIAENKIKNTIALLHWFVAAKRYNKKRKNGGFYEKGVFVFNVSRRFLRKQLDNDYFKIVSILIEQGYLVCNHFYYSYPDNSKCKSYGPTQKLIYELNDHMESYLNKLIETMQSEVYKIKKQNLKVLCESKFDGDIIKKEFSNEVLADWVQNWPEIKKVLDKLSLNKAIVNRGFLISMLEGRVKKYRQISEKTGRIYTRMNNITNAIRQHAVIDGKKFALDLDMRACHLSFLADHFFLNRHDLTAGMKKEWDQWRAIFESEKPHPRDFISAQSGIQVKNLKKSLNAWINGKRFAEFDEYMKEHWPFIWDAYDNCDQSNLGNQISLNLESKIFRSDWIVALQDKHNVITVDCHDGFLVYGDQVDSIKFATDFIEKAREILGWKVFFSISTQWIDVDIEEQKKAYQQKIDKAKETGDMETFKKLYDELPEFLSDLKFITE